MGSHDWLYGIDLIDPTDDGDVLGDFYGIPMR